MAAGGGLVDLYAVLGVSSSASKAEITKAYRKQALRYHPDKVAPLQRAAATDRFREVARAYDVLRQDSRRRLYDETGIYDGNADSGGGNSAYDTFYESFFGDEARGSDGRSADYTYYSLTNYDQLTLKEEDLPPYMHDIVKVGLHYLATVVEDLACREVVFLRHQRVDILYVMLAYFEPLDQKAFEDGYIIHYYDNPLQKAITPCWSDQNVLGGSKKRLSMEVRKQRVLSEEQFARRQDYARMALTAPDPQFALEEKYAAGCSKPKQDAPVHQLANKEDHVRADVDSACCMAPLMWVKRAVFHRK